MIDKYRFNVQGDGDGKTSEDTNLLNSNSTRESIDFQRNDMALNNLACNTQI